MTFLPIVDRELRVQARQKRTFRLRLANAATAMALVSFMLLVNQCFSTPGSLALDWTPGPADLLIVGSHSAAEMLGLCRGLRCKAGRSRACAPAKRS